MAFSTFNDLYKFLQNYNKDNILFWLDNPWKGKDKQESLLRIFASLGLISKLNKYTICVGNFNNGSIKPIKTYRDFFLNSNNIPIYLKDKGDSSDLTGIYNNNIIAITSKNINKENVGKLDIEKILLNGKQYEEKGWILDIGVVVRNRKRYGNMIERIEQSNYKLKNILEKESTILIDWEDLNEAFHAFQKTFCNIPLETILNSNKPPLVFRLHQKLGILKTLRMKKEGKTDILWGHIQRSGKSYIMSGSIIDDSLDKAKCNYLIITTSPNETISQYLNVLDCLQLKDYNVVYLKGDNKNPTLKDKNIIICSKQFLQGKIDKKDESTNNIPWLKRIQFDIRFLDESHNGGTTKLTKKTLKCYGNGSFTVHITATYSKPVSNYNIKRDSWILWDMEDIKLCKTVENESSQKRLIDKHGEEFVDVLKKSYIENVVKEYTKFPELHILSSELTEESVEKIIKNTNDNNYGWSITSAFLLLERKAEFQNKEENLKIWYRIFGLHGEYGIPHEDYPDNKVFIKRIEYICKNPHTGSRFIGEFKEPIIIMAFLPQNNINNCSIATKSLLDEYNVVPEYEIVIINSKACGSRSKDVIEEGRLRALNGRKKGVLVLSGRQCSLGVSMPSCDIVLLLNDNTSFDMIYQMMFRCMTEDKDKNKGCGFVVDLNINRVIQTSLIDYGSILKPELHPCDSVKYILKSRLINLNADHWMPCFGKNRSRVDILAKNIYKIYSSNTERALTHILNRLRYKELLLTNDEQNVFNTLFSFIKPTQEKVKKIHQFLEDDSEEKIKKGIEKIEAEEEAEEEAEKPSEKEIEEKEKINYFYILSHIIPLLCLFTIHQEESSFVEMLDLIKADSNTYHIFLEQIKSWWGKCVDSIVLKKIIIIYIKYMKSDNETNQIIRTVKELFRKNIGNAPELSIIIDKYLIPQEMEKKTNAEISTPNKLRKEMLDKIPLDFWEGGMYYDSDEIEVHTIFEPCCGKGGFLIDIVGRLMVGLEYMIPDKEKRYRTIVERCLYWGDINPTNIFICKLLLDPYNKYKLNYHEGDTLELDVGEKWGIQGFDAVIGNPPYQSNNDDGSRKAKNHSLYTSFISYSLTNLNNDGYLLFINPSSFMSLSRNMKIFNEMKKCNILYINLEGAKKYFKVGSSFCWYLLKNTKTSIKTVVDCFYKKKLYNSKINFDDIKFVPLLLTKESVSIINKVLSTKNKFKIETNTILHAGIKKNKIHLSKIKNDKFKYKVVHTPKQTFYTDIKHPLQGSYKVFIPLTTYYEQMLVDNALMTQGCYFIITQSEESATNIKELLLNNVYRFIVNICRWGNFNSPRIIEQLPKIDIYTNVNKLFNITSDEIKLIESCIKI
jgi:hypothetical protein